MSVTMQTATRTVSNDSRGSSSHSSGSTNSSVKGGILANAHEAPKKPIKPADSSFTSALKAAFIPQQAGKQMRKNGKPLGKSFERTQPLMTRGHEGGEVLKKDPRGQNAPCGDGIVLSSGEEDEDEEQGSIASSEEPWSPISATSASVAASSPGETNSTSWEQATRGRSATTNSNPLARSTSIASSQNSSNNPCSIKFAPLPSSGRLKRANSITIGVAARSQLLHSQGAGRSNSSNGSNNSAAWQAQFNAQRNVPPQQQQQQPQQPPPSKSVIRHDDTVDVGEEIRKGALKAWRRMRKGSSASNTSSNAAVDGNGDNQIDKVQSVEEEEEEAHELASGEKTPKRSHSPPRMSSLHRDDLNDEPDGTRTPRGSMQRRMSTGLFIGNNAFMGIEEKRKRQQRGLENDDDDDDKDKDREESAKFAEALGRTHASRVAHHTVDDKWHPGMNVQSDGIKKTTEIGVVESEPSSDNESFVEAKSDLESEEEEEDDEESREAERMAEEALHAHSEKATHAGAVEKMEKKRR